jgi:methionyl aminopeptidase
MLHALKKFRLGPDEREGMRAAGRFNAQLLDAVRPLVRAGVKTAQIDEMVNAYTRDHGHVPACLGYHGFPRSCCISVNEVICHGIPGDYELRDGDIVNVDVTSIVAGWHGDQSETFLIGEVSTEARQLTQCAFDCLYIGIAAARPEGLISDIGDAIVAEASKRGFSVVAEYIGHGLGKFFHQPPNIPHVPTQQSRRERLSPGVCFTVEPMINAGGAATKLDPSDGWTVRTKDGRLSAQFEHTVLMTEKGPEILTQTTLGPAPGSRF